MINNIFLGLLTPIISIIASYNLIFKTITYERKKAISNIVQCCIFSGGAFVIAQLLILLFYLLFFPADINNVVPPIIGPMVSIFEYSKPLYFTMSFVNSFLVGAAYACLSYSISTISSKKLLSIVLPYILYRSTIFTGSAFYILPFDSFSPDAFPSRGLLSYYLSIIIVFIISILLICIKFKKGKSTT